MPAYFTIFQERLILEYIVGSSPYVFLLIIIFSRTTQIFHLPTNFELLYSVSLRIKIFITLSLSILLALIPVLAFIYDDFWLNQNDKTYLTLIFLSHSFVLLLQSIFMSYEFKKRVPSPWYSNLLFWAIIALLYFIFLMNSILFQVNYLFKLFLKKVGLSRQCFSCHRCFKNAYGFWIARLWSFP